MNRIFPPPFRHIVTIADARDAGMSSTNRTAGVAIAEGAVPQRSAARMWFRVPQPSDTGIGFRMQDPTAYQSTKFQAF